MLILIEATDSVTGCFTSKFLEWPSGDSWITSHLNYSSTPTIYFEWRKSQKLKKSAWEFPHENNIRENTPECCANIRRILLAVRMLLSIFAIRLASFSVFGISTVLLWTYIFSTLLSGWHVFKPVWSTKRTIFTNQKNHLMLSINRMQSVD